MIPQQSTILVVDDGFMGRSALDALLRPAGYYLAFAANGHEALAIAADIIPDLVLLDVMMPDMDGFEVCQRLRATPQLAEVPIILVTALDDRESRLRGIQAGADDFLSKPFDRIELRTRIQTITQLNRYRRLVAARAQFEWVVDQADDGYLMLHEDDTIRYANPQARRLLELASNPDTPLPHTFQTYAQRQFQCEPAVAWSAWLSAEPQAQPLYLVLPESPSTAAFWLQVEVLSMPHQSQAERLVRLRDVTSHISMQRDLRRFHAMINHKLRTPLVSIVTSLELLARHTTKLSADELRDIVGIATKGTQRLRGEIEDILQYTQAPVLAQPTQGTTVAHMGALVTNIATALDLSHIQVAWQPHTADVQLPLSPRAVELVVWELLENSKKFHPAHTPTVDVLAYQASPTAVHLRFRDDGRTLTPKQLADAWLPYYQAEKEFTGQIEGMGLGLALVATLVWSVGGTCHIRNCIGVPGVEIELVLHIKQDQAVTPAYACNTQSLAVA